MPTFQARALMGGGLFHARRGRMVGMNSRRKIRGSAIALELVVAFWTLTAVVFDEQCLFEYLPRLGFGAVAIGTVLVFASWWPKAAAASAIFLGFWLAALYPIRWNNLKSFYIDSHSLRRGDVNG
jgi:hypothetical protein